MRFAHRQAIKGFAAITWGAYDSRQYPDLRPRDERPMQIATVQPGKTRVGFIGTGVMGQSMCRHLMTAGYSMTVSTRTKSKAQPLLDAGATWADTPQAVAEMS